MMVSLVVTLFYLCYGKFRFTFDKTTTIFGGLYAVCYCVCTVALLKASKIGYVSLTSLIFSYSLILPALFGIFAYSTSPSVAFYFGLALFAVSLFFLGKKKTSEEKKSFSVKWLIYVLAAFFANGGCSILQTHQQRLCKTRRANGIIHPYMAVAEQSISLKTRRKTEFKHNHLWL